MTVKYPIDRSILMLIAGAKGAIGSTIAAAVCALKAGDGNIAPYLTTDKKFTSLGIASDFEFAGWDREEANLNKIIETLGILSDSVRHSQDQALKKIVIKSPPGNHLDFSSQVHQLIEDMQQFTEKHPGSIPIMVNLLPAAPDHSLADVSTMEALYTVADPLAFPDLTYVTAAVLSGIPIVNFTPNEVEIPIIMEEARRRNIPISGRDGKTGQTYFKVALASALKARNLAVDGWYSLNILGNADGRNLMDPHNAEGKLKNKTNLLEDILGYPVGAAYDGPTHKVHIDYYPPRGDAKEAWDVIDFNGVFGLPMSMRLNLQGRDSILAAPLVMDLCRWMAALAIAGRAGAVPELAFYFKKAVGAHAPVTFEEQLAALQNLEQECKNKQRKQG